MNWNENSEIVIDKEGVWYFRGTEMKRKDIVLHFYNHLRKDQNGNYRIEIENDSCSVTLEDAPYVIKRVDVSTSRGDDRLYFELLLNDDSKEALDISTLFRRGGSYVLYCRVKMGQHEARFSRPAYYQFCEHIEYDAENEHYYVRTNSHSSPLNIY